MPDPADMPMPPMDLPSYAGPGPEMDDDFGYPMEPWMYPSPRYYRYQQPYRSYNYGYRRSYGPGYQREQSYSYPPGISRSWEGPAPYGYRWRRYYPGTQ